MIISTLNLPYVNQMEPETPFKGTLTPFEGPQVESLLSCSFPGEPFAESLKNRYPRGSNSLFLFKQAGPVLLARALLGPSRAPLEGATDPLKSVEVFGGPTLGRFWCFLPMSEMNLPKKAWPTQYDEASI